MNLFPELAIQGGELTDPQLPIYKEMAYDFEKNEFSTRNGKYYLVEKNEALKIWIYKALSTPRYRYQAYTRQYGHELEEVIGLTRNRGIIESEMKRYIEECLLANPYIQSVDNFGFEYGNVTTVSFTVTTVYGDADIEQEVIL